MNAVSEQFVTAFSQALVILRRVAPEALDMITTRDPGKAPYIPQYEAVGLSPFSLAKQPGLFRPSVDQKMVQLHLTEAAAEPAKAYDFSLADAVFVLDRLVYRERIQDAGALATTIAAIGVEHWLVQSLVYLHTPLSRPDAGQQLSNCLQTLTTHSEQLTESQMFYARKTISVCCGASTSAAYLTKNSKTLSHLHRLWKALDPEYRRQFASPKPAPFFTSDTTNPLHRGDKQTAPGRVGILVRENFYPEAANSRPSDVPIRLKRTLEKAGWDTDILTYRSFRNAESFREDLQSVLEVWSADPPDVIMCDELRLELIGPKDRTIAEWLGELRKRCPELKIIAR